MTPTGFFIREMRVTLKPRGIAFIALYFGLLAGAFILVADPTKTANPVVAFIASITPVSLLGLPMVAAGLVQVTNPRNPENWYRTTPVPPRLLLAARLGAISIFFVLLPFLVIVATLAFTFPAHLARHAGAVFLIQWTLFWGGCWLGTLCSDKKTATRYGIGATVALIAPALAYGLLKKILGHDPFPGNSHADFVTNVFLLLGLFGMLFPTWCLRAWRRPHAPIRFLRHAPAFVLIFFFVNFAPAIFSAPESRPETRPVVTACKPMIRGGGMSVNGTQFVDFSASVPALPSAKTARTLPFRGTATDEATGKIRNLYPDRDDGGEIYFSGYAWDIPPELQARGYRFLNAPGEFLGYEATRITLRLRESAGDTDTPTTENLRGKTLRLRGVVRQIETTSRILAEMPAATGGVMKTGDSIAAFTAVASDDTRAEIGFTDVEFCKSRGLDMNQNRWRLLLVRDDLRQALELSAGGGSGTNGGLLTRRTGNYSAQLPEKLPAGWCEKARIVVVGMDETQVEIPVDTTVTLPAE